ncbi:MAG: STAS domain-containing protein [Candidatus Euphemobacter frigidus]|nr:STAS domain-containing protein [Candidatus Euphemobacter frigidus]MDP8276042.1 STAS domain-containing protein [Candidatus Euphemobacter frigidus]
MVLKVTVREKESGVFSLMPVGSIDTGTAPILEKEVDAILEKDPRVVIFDMGGVEYISSMGVRVFIKTKKDLKRIGGRLMMVNLPPQIKKVFDIIYALPKEEIFESIEELDEYLTAMQRQVLEDQD